MNHRITALRLQKHNHQRINVYLDGEYAFGLARIVTAWLQVGQEISDEKITQLQSEDTREAAYQRALKSISYRPRTEIEIRRNLAAHALSKENIDYVVERLKRSGLINDTSYAQDWVESRAANHPRSRRSLAYELEQRGIDTEIIAQTLDTIDDEEMAYQAALSRARKLNQLEWKAFLRKMYRYLSQRGFNHEISSQAISRVWEQIRTTDQSLDHEALL